ncbi:MAG TPA: hypothetical protein PLN99_00170 [Daejeonella sp.]|nr:hypothetical protein [Daejeonella sp.]
MKITGKLTWTPEQILTVVSDASENEVVAAVNEAGYEAEKVNESFLK